MYTAKGAGSFVSANQMSKTCRACSPYLTLAKLGFFFVGDAVKGRKYAPARKQVLDRWHGKSRSSTGRDGIRSQDFWIWEEQQIARHSPVADDVVFSPVWESNVHHFQKQLLDTMQD